MCALRATETTPEMPAPETTTAATRGVPVSGDLAEYEARSAERLGIPHAVAFGYARHALVAILSALGLGEGDGVALSPLTCRILPLSLLSIGIRPVFTDIDRRTLNIDPKSLRDAPDARAVLFQHTYGNDAGLPETSAVARERGLRLVEDCAQCMPGGSGRQTPGALGEAAIFSNNLLKPLPAASGGLAVTGSDALAARIRKARDELPAPGVGESVRLGLSRAAHRLLLTPRTYWTLLRLSRLLGGSPDRTSVRDAVERQITATALRASPRQGRLGIAALDRLDEWSLHRTECCADYREVLRGTPDVEVPTIDPALPLLYFPVLVPDKPDLLRRARKARFEIVAWPESTPIYPLESEAALREHGYEPGSCPVAEEVARSLVGLPTHRGITEDVRRRVVELVAAGADR